jgi:hypothetical protein
MYPSRASLWWICGGPLSYRHRDFSITVSSGDIPGCEKQILSCYSLQAVVTVIDTTQVNSIGEPPILMVLVRHDKRSLLISNGLS